MSVFADISEYCGFWANDMVVSLAGFSYVGNFGFDLDARLKELGVERFIAEPPPTTNLVVLDAEGDDHPGHPRHGVPQRHGDHARRGDVDRRRDLRVESRRAFDVRADGTLMNRAGVGATSRAP